MAESQSLSVLKSLQAENLLQGWGIMKVLREIRPSMVYKDQPFSDHFDAIQASISQIGRMQLRSRVDITTASEYLVELATNYERILEGVNRCTMDTQSLLGRCKAILAKIETMRGPFHVLWSIGAGEITSDCAGLKKVKDADWKALAAMEFTSIVEEADQELTAMIEALDYTLDNLKIMRRTAAETYAIGKDQVNAALSELDQTDKGIGEGTGMAAQRSSIVALQGLFGSRVKQAQVGTQVEDDLPADEPSASEITEVPPAPEAPVAEPSLPPAPKEGKSKRKQELTPTVTVVAPDPTPEAPKVEEKPQTPAPPVVEPKADIQKAVQEDPFISSAQKTEILKQVTEAPAPATEEDDFPGDVAPQAATAEEDDFPVGAEVINATPASKELAAPQTETQTPVDETPAPVAETKPVETEKPKANPKPTETKPATETKPRAAGGLFGKRTLPPNMEAAPTFVPKSTVAAGSNEGLEEFM